MERSKIGKYSNAKGKRYERNLCKKLSQFFFDRNDLFTRYGAEYAGQLPGDIGPFIKNNITATIEFIRKFPFCFECKKREEWSFKELFISDNNHIWNYWKQCEEQANRFDKHPVLIISKNYYPDFIMLQKNTTINQFDLFIPDTHIRIKGNWYIINLKDFIEDNKNTTIILTLKNEMLKLL